VEPATYTPETDDPFQPRQHDPTSDPVAAGARGMESLAVQNRGVDAKADNTGVSPLHLINFRFFRDAIYGY